MTRSYIGSRSVIKLTKYSTGGVVILFCLGYRELVRSAASPAESASCTVIPDLTPFSFGPELVVRSIYTLPCLFVMLRSSCGACERRGNCEDCEDRHSNRLSYNNQKHAQPHLNAPYQTQLPGGFHRSLHGHSRR